jgi:hypothetical protein
VSACGSGGTTDNPEIRLGRSNVSACGSGNIIDNSEIRLRRSNVSACGSGDTIDNPEIRLRRSNVSACGSGETTDNPEIRVRRSYVSACGSGNIIDNSEQQCSVCSRFLSKCMFSKRQLTKISVIARKCSFCLQEIARNGSLAVILLREHSMSNRLVDGILHSVPGKMRLDRACHAHPEDRIEAKQVLCNFITKFHVVDQSVENICNLKFNNLSYQSFMAMTFIQPDTPIPREYMNDFLTTIRHERPVTHKKISVIPTTSSSHSYQVDIFKDSPTMTRASILKFCNNCPEEQYITSFLPNRVVRHQNGTVLLNSNRILIGARCSKKISNKTGHELLLIYQEMEHPF